MGHMRTRPRTDCPCCAGAGRVLYRGIVDVLYGAPGEWGFRQCTNAACGALWLDPSPVPQDLLLAYQSYHTHEVQKPRSGRAPLTRVFRAGLGALAAASGLLRERQRADSMFLEGAEAGRLLDVGCGQGAFIARMARSGWSVRGVDMDPAAVRTARELHGLDIRVGGIESVSGAASVDVITASHVIEHLADPHEFLAHCRRLLAPRGKVILRTPNAESLGHRLYGRNWRGLEAPRHLCLFTPRALTNVAIRAGFAVNGCFTSDAMSESILVVSQILRMGGSLDPGTGSKWALRIAKTAGPLLALGARLYWLCDRGSGEEVCAIFSRDAGA